MIETTAPRTGEALAASIRAAAARSLAQSLERRARRAGAHAVLYRRDAMRLRGAAMSHELGAR
jgi:hypothetical protein